MLPQISKQSFFLCVRGGSLQSGSCTAVVTFPQLFQKTEVWDVALCCTIAGIIIWDVALCHWLNNCLEYGAGISWEFASCSTMPFVESWRTCHGAVG